MTTYPSPLSTTPALTDEATLEVALDCLQQHLPIQMEGGYSPQELFELLLRAASRGDSIEHTARQLQGVGNAIDLLFLASESVGIEESPQPIPTHGFRTRSLPRL